MVEAPEQSKAPAGGLRMRTAILLVLVLAVLPSLVLQVGIYYYWFRGTYRHEVLANLELSRSLAGTFEGYVNALGQHEATLAVAFTEKGLASPEEMYTYLRTSATEFPALNAFLFINPRGRIVASSDRRLIGLDVKDRDYFQEACRTKGYYLSDLLEGRADPEPIFIVARGVYGDDRLLGVIAASVEPARLGDAVLKVPRSGQGAISIFDRRGGLVYRYPSGPLTWEDRVNSEPSDILKQALAGQEAEGIYRFRGEGEPRLGACVPIQGLGWAAGVGEPVSEVIAGPQKALLLAIGINAAVVALSVAGAWLVIRTITHGVSVLRSRAVAIGKGLPHVAASPGRITEIRELSSAFSEMVADRREAEQTLRESEEEFRAFFENAAVGAVQIDRDGHFVRVNDRYCQITGYTRAELQGRGPQELVHPDDREEDQRRIAQFMAGELPVYDFEKRYVRKDGRVVWAHLTSALIRSPDGKALRTAAIVEDITERKGAEEELKNTAAELARSNRDLAQFAAAASHDLQEPLRTIQGHLGIVERRLSDKLDEGTRRSMEFAVEGAARMEALIRDLLAYSRAGQAGKEFVEVDMEALLSEVVEGLRASIEAAGASVLHEPLPKIKAQATQMSQLIQNLLGNAIKYRSKDNKPEIHVGARREGGAWTFQVRDNGIGIRPQDAERIFLIFHRLHTRQEYPGTGIGLAICKKIVENQGGRIWVESKPGEGSAFFFTIPNRG
jgi:PAS domain S-box-containing protein